jgi:predicted dinucleotide-binding enzyme
MTIGTIGTGKMASALASLWAAKGHAIMLGSRHPGDVRKNTAPGDPLIRFGAIADAVAFGNVVLLATPWGAAHDALRGAGSLQGKTLVDCTNPMSDRQVGGGMEIGRKTSAAEEIAQWAEGAMVFKAFNSIYWENLKNPRFGNRPVSGFYCGAEGEAKKTVAALINDAGFEPVDCGPLSSARYLEPLAFLWMQLAFERGLGKDIALTLVKR